MIDEQKLIQLLNQSGAQSGTYLGDQLGVSRVAVQKKIQALVENGLPIEAVSGKGYSLPEGVALLNESEIRQHLIKPEAFIKSELLDVIEVLQSVPSTNSHLLAQPVLVGRAKACVAEAQTSGRGRRGNDWQSAPYRNIMLSMSWGFENWPATITGLGLAVALSLTEMLNARFDLDVKIKWPNDLMVGDAKLAGVLIDVAGESSGACNVIIGVGLNVHQPDWSDQNDLAYRWQDLAGLGVDVNRNELVAAMLGALTLMLEEFGRSGFGVMMDRWNELSSYANRAVRVGNDGSAVTGKMLGVDVSGALLVQDARGVTHQFSESTVSVRLV